jgi:Acetyl-CoA hydrolase/transferase C-terminal domain
VRMLRTETTNDPAVISRNPRMISINSALPVDPFAQANAARRPPGLSSRIYSGFGGQTDFVVGAMHSAGGRAIIALPSWHQRADVSTIVPLVDGPVTPFQQTHRGDLFATGRLCSSSAANKSARRPRRRGRMPRDTMRQAGWGHAGAARGRGSRRISHRARGGLRGGPG